MCHTQQEAVAVGGACVSAVLNRCKPSLLSQYYGRYYYGHGYGYGYGRGPSAGKGDA